MRHRISFWMAFIFSTLGLGDLQLNQWEIKKRALFSKTGGLVFLVAALFTIESPKLMVLLNSLFSFVKRRNLLKKGSFILAFVAGINSLFLGKTLTRAQLPIESALSSVSGEQGGRTYKAHFPFPRELAV
jgi:hypothetical protein